jgi:S1-C subfamily serine protease
VDTDAAAVQLGLDASVRGAAVTVVYPGGPGDRAELAVGDVIVAAGGSGVESAAALSRILARLDVGVEVELELIDTAGPRLVRLTLVRRR